MHHIAIESNPTADNVTTGAITQVGAAGPRPPTRNIAALAGEAGVYRPSVHRAMAEGRSVLVPRNEHYDHITIAAIGSVASGALASQSGLIKIIGASWRILSYAPLRCVRG